MSNQDSLSNQMINFKAAFEAIPGIHVLLKANDPVFTILAVTDEYCSISGKKREEITGMGLFEVFPPNTADPHFKGDQEFAASFRYVIQNKKPHQLPVQRYDVQNEAGVFEERFWSANNKPVVDEAGNVLYIIHSSIDITHEIKAEQREEGIKDIEKAFKLFMQAPVVMGILRGDDYVIELANEGILEVWGRTKEVIGKPLLEGVPELRGQGYIELLDEVRRTGKPYHAYEAPIAFLRNGKEEVLYFDFVYQPFYENETDKIATGVIGVGHDITEQVKSRKKVAESEERFRTLANSIFQLAWTANADGWVNWYNDRWYEYTGTTLEEMQGWGWEKVYHPDHIERVVALVKEAWQNPEPFEITAPLRRKDGTYRWFLTRAHPVLDSEGAIVKWVGTNTDIEEQKQTERLLEEKVLERTSELERQKNLFDNILKNSSNGISVTEMIRDARGQVIDAATILANDAAVKYVGLPREIYLSKTAAQLDPDILASPYGQTCLKTLETGEPSFIQYYLDASGRWLELTISKMDNNRLIHIFTDVTPIKEAQLQLEKTVGELKRSNTNLEEFAYAASHDLKEPIRKIHFFNDRLKNALKDRVTEDEGKTFDRMEVATKRMGTLIDDLLSYSQVSLRPRLFEEVNLNQLIDLVLNDLDVEIEEKNARIKVGNLFTIKGHHRQLQQAFQNLIANALKYSKPDQAPLVTITGERVRAKDVSIELGLNQKEYYLVAISDNGIGFEQKDVERIFNVFTRLHGNADYRGTGVGLSIVRKVIENHNGVITAESEPGRGATFKIYLPADN